MLRFLCAAFLVAVSFVSASDESIGGSRKGTELASFLRANYRPTAPLSYNQARQRMFAEIDSRSGKVRCVYTGVEITTSGIPNGNEMNTEHTWPQSKFDERSPMRADLHHLFPTLNKPNGIRSNLPFGEVPDETTTGWWRSNTKQTQKPKAAEINEFSESFATKFEPREDHKGNVARAMLYFWVVYGNDDIESNFIDAQMATLLQWHVADPANDEERARNSKVKALQGNFNPFVLDPALALRIVRSSPETSPSDLIPTPQSAPNVAANPAAVRLSNCNCNQRPRRFRRCR